MPGTPADPDPERTVLHGGCVSLAGRGLLILGPSGSGKSALALRLMALGAGLVADDRVVLRRQGPALLAEPPATIRGLIEARGIGILRAEVAAPVALCAVVDLARTETRRLPPPREMVLLGTRLPLFFRVEAAHFPAALIQFLKTGLRTDASHG